VGSEATTYTLDLAAPLVQVLVANEDGTRTAYLYGIARIGEEDSAWQYYLADHLGSVRSLVDGQGSVAGTRAYQPYGAPLSSAGVAESMYGFTGEQTDPTGLVYLRARMYAPGLELFLSRDPWGGSDSRPLTLHEYLYALANPANNVDPTGYFSLKQIAGFFDSHTYSGALVHFAEGMAMQGRWAWLEVLRQLDEGDFVWMWRRNLYCTNIPVPPNWPGEGPWLEPVRPIYRGAFGDQERIGGGQVQVSGGKLYIGFEGFSIFQMSQPVVAAANADYYDVLFDKPRPNPLGMWYTEWETYAYKKYTALRRDPTALDVRGLLLDVAGVASFGWLDPDDYRLIDKTLGILNEAGVLDPTLRSQLANAKDGAELLTVIAQNEGIPDEVILEIAKIVSERIFPIWGATSDLLSLIEHLGIAELP
jgi:RHS repeat-associated protein